MINPHDKHGDPEGVITHPDQLEGIDASLVVLVKDIAAKLERAFPGWLWAVQPDKRGGVINIFSLRCSGKYGYRIHTKNIQSDAHRKLAIEAGGEILERFGFKRGRYDYQKWQSAKRYMGLVDMDITDKSQKEQRRRRDDAFTQAVREGRIKLRIQDTPTATGTYRQLIIAPSANWER